MICTAFSHLTTEELLAYALGKGQKTPLEQELAQRLALAVDMITEKDHGEYTRG